jgi:NAD(P)-dependent dehydrogenase (short-subunit alcohol dehydrogenase family)
MSLSRRALVVGGTSGIGQGIALALAKRQYEVILAGRSEARGQAVIQKMEGVNHQFVSINAFDLASVKQVADSVGGNIDVLVMTHGMATLQGYTPTKDGLDEKLQLHYFSRIYLAGLLAPKMKEGSRILTVLSAGVHNKYKQAEADFELKEHYSIQNAADAAGYYTDAGFEALSEKYPTLTIAHAAPGFVNTNWGTEMPFFVRSAIRPLQALFGTSLENCGERLTKGLFDLPSVGFSLMDPKGNSIEKAKGIKHTAAERDMIWEKTAALLPDVLQ